jgi:hypothetical protein
MKEPESRARLRLSNGRTEQSMVGVETVLNGAATRGLSTSPSKRRLCTLCAKFGITLCHDHVNRDTSATVTCDVGLVSGRFRLASFPFPFPSFAAMATLLETAIFWVLGIGERWPYEASSFKSEYQNILARD